MKQPAPRTINQFLSNVAKTNRTYSFRTPVSQNRRNMSTSNLSIENTNIKTAAGVELSSQQKTLIGSVLDLFGGRPSLEKLQLWKDEAVFEDPITIARGRKQFEPQWYAHLPFLFQVHAKSFRYGLQTVFSEIEQIHHEVTSSGNPITIDMKSRYVVKGIGKEETISSVVNIFTTPDGMIEKVEDKWNGTLPDSAIANVSFRKAVSPLWWMNYGIAWVFWLWSFIWYTRVWMVRLS